MIIIPKFNILPSLPFSCGSYNPSLALPLQRRGNRISSLPTLLREGIRFLVFPLCKGELKGIFETCVYKVAIWERG
jgi:hypothetical protein